jgi:hypothetical protein
MQSCPCLFPEFDCRFDPLLYFISSLALFLSSRQAQNVMKQSFDVSRFISCKSITNLVLPRAIASGLKTLKNSPSALILPRFVGLIA